MSLTTKYRQPTEEDTNFIFNSWLKSFRNSEFAKPQCNEVYYNNYKKIVNDILHRSLILIVCNEQDENQVFGYIVYEELPFNNLCVHYVYVKYTFRKWGIARNLLESIRTSTNPIFISHNSKSIEKVATKYKFIYNPYMAFYEGVL